MRQRLDNAEAFGLRVWDTFKLKALTQTLTGAFTVDADSPPVLNLDPGGAARVVTLPAVNEGLVYFINNAADAAEAITVNNPAAAGIGDILQNEMGVAFCLGGVWYLRLVGTST